VSFTTVVDRRRRMRPTMDYHDGSYTSERQVKTP